MVKSLVFLLLLMLLWSAAEILLKYGVAQTGELELSLRSLWRVAWNPWVVFSIFVSGTAFLFWIGVLMRMELGFAWYVTSLMYFFILVGARLFLNEPITPLKILGIGLITVGVIAISMERGHVDAPRPPNPPAQELP